MMSVFRSKKISPDLSKEEFLALAKKKMHSSMPKSEHHEIVYYNERNLEYCYFSALWHIKNNLITAKIVRALQDGASMLSVGAGHGHLERLLAQGFKVPKENISIADICLAENISNFGFPSYVFDMTQKWPEFNRPFNYVIFPESLGEALLAKERTLPIQMRNRVTHKFPDDVAEIIHKVISNKEVSASDSEFYLSLIEQDIPRAKWTAEVVSEAIKYLSKDGEVRISRGGGINNGQHYAYVALKLKNKAKVTPSYGLGPAIFRKYS